MADPVDLASVPSPHIYVAGLSRLRRMAAKSGRRKISRKVIPDVARFDRTRH